MLLCALCNGSVSCIFLGEVMLVYGCGPAFEMVQLLDLNKVGYERREQYVSIMLCVFRQGYGD